MKVRTGFLTAVVVAAGLVSAPAALASNGTSTAGTVHPSAHAGNFVASDDDQVCYEIAKAAGYTEALRSEVRGLKIDPPVDFANAFISVDVSDDGKYLDWSTTNARMLAVVVKGGTNYHLYNYQSSGILADQRLHSPMQKKTLPQISHYNVCYLPTPPSTGTQGCTPGFWRNDTPANRPSWRYLSPLSPTSVFTGTITFQQALDASGGGTNALLRHAAAGYLNADMGTPYVDYPYTTGQVMDMFNSAYTSGDPVLVESTKNQLNLANELGCPLSATNPEPATS